METFAKNLKKRAEELNLSNAEVARRVGVSERRYAHYVSGRNEPDLALLLKIASLLRTTPNDLLGFDLRQPEPSKRAILFDRLIVAAKVMKDVDLETTAIQAEAIAGARRR
jgi:transcriptional regulator with XRE-family HTH domain